LDQIIGEYYQMKKLLDLMAKKIIGPEMVRVEKCPGENPDEDTTIVIYGGQKSQQRLEIKGDFELSVQKISPSPDATLK
jgi:hypothetical protein